MGKHFNAKIVTLVLLGLILVLALKQVDWKVQERRAARNAAIASVAHQSAGTQKLSGPLIWIRCTEFRNEETATGWRRVPMDCSRIVRPTHLEYQGALDVSERSRGLFKARLFLTGLHFKARFPAGVANLLKPGETPFLILSVSDPRGIKGVRLDLGDKRLTPSPGGRTGTAEGGFHLPLAPHQLAGSPEFSGELELIGSGSVELAPVGENNDIQLRSAWPHPSFIGQFLPDTRRVGTEGFTAHWRVNDFATGGQVALGKSEGPVLGVSLLDPVDAYTQTDRAVRYGFLFILLTLAGFFLFELLKNAPLQPLQYLLAGAAVVMFFLLLLALSEHLDFALAYLIAALACTLMLTAYGRSLTGRWRHAALLGAGYGGLYAGLYQLLISEDYALLMGAWFLFALLGAAMWTTRRLGGGKPAVVESEGV